MCVTVCVRVCSGIEQQCLVMSKDQISDKCDSADSRTIMHEQQSAALNPVMVTYDDDEGDEDDDETMQFATETIFKYFSLSVSNTSK